MTHFAFENRSTLERITIKAASVYDAWSKLREDRDHKEWLRMGVAEA